MGRRTCFLPQAPFNLVTPLPTAMLFRRSPYNILFVYNRGLQTFLSEGHICCYTIVWGPDFLRNVIVSGKVAFHQITNFSSTYYFFIIDKMASRAVVWRPLAYNDSRKFSLPFEVQAFMTEEKRRSGQSLNRDRLDVTTASGIAPSAAMEANIYIRDCCEQIVISGLWSRNPNFLDGRAGE